MGKGLHFHLACGRATLNERILSWLVVVFSRVNLKHQEN